jgi:hypothetical protein
VKNPLVVLRQKEVDLVRVRKEVDALRTVLPLLDDPMQCVQELISSRGMAQPPDDNGMAELELYFPFIKNMRQKSKVAGD